MNYERYRDVAKRLIPKYGTVGSITSTVKTIPDPAQPWNATYIDNVTPIQLCSFPDDGVLFVNHNITGNVRVLLVAPSAQLTEVFVGDVVKYGTQTAAVKQYKTIDPDGSGAILWALLVV